MKTAASPWLLAAQDGESDADLRERRDQAYFAWQRADNAEFWRRLGDPPIPLAGATIIDLGCGHGALAVDAATRGAASVLGLDLDTDRIAFARRHIPQTYPDLAPTLTFRAADIAAIDHEAGYDIVLCKDTMEHIIDLEGVVADVHRLLRPGGRFVIGTSPLYYSPFGDHGRYLGPGIPWLGALIPEPLLFRAASRKQARQIRTAADVGLNKMTPARFRALFTPQAWTTERLHYNAGTKPLLRTLRTLRRIRPLEPYLTISIYAVMQRT